MCSPTKVSSNGDMAKCDSAFTHQVAVANAGQCRARRGREPFVGCASCSGRTNRVGCIAVQAFWSWGGRFFGYTRVWVVLGTSSFGYTDVSECMCGVYYAAV